MDRRQPPANDHRASSTATASSSADYRRKLKPTDIQDGTSNTFAIGEAILSLDNHTSWPYSNNACVTCASAPTPGKRRQQLRRQ
jgi:hypothetical protein